MLQKALIFVLSMLSTHGVAAAQAPLSPMRMLDVDGVQMRVWTAGLEQRKAGQPVIVLEAGAGADLETWKPIFADAARIGPVVAYDRRALGQSGADTVSPTFTRTVRTLRAVLQTLKVPAPYVLVGHSMGGVFIRGFASMYPAETAGMVYLDVPDFESTREERAAVLPAEDRKAALAPPVLPEIPAGTPPGLAAVYQQQLNEMRDDFHQRAAGSSRRGFPSRL